MLAPRLEQRDSAGSKCTPCASTRAARRAARPRARATLAPSRPWRRAVARARRSGWSARRRIDLIEALGRVRLNDERAAAAPPARRGAEAPSPPSSAGVHVGTARRERRPHGARAVVVVAVVAGVVAGVVALGGGGVEHLIDEGARRVDGGLGALVAVVVGAATVHAPCRRQRAAARAWRARAARVAAVHGRQYTAHVVPWRGAAARRARRTRGRRARRRASRAQRGRVCRATPRTHERPVGRRATYAACGDACRSMKPGSRNCVRPSTRNAAAAAASAARSRDLRPADQGVSRVTRQRRRRRAARRGGIGARPTPARGGGPRNRPRCRGRRACWSRRRLPDRQKPAGGSRQELLEISGPNLGIPRPRISESD